MRVLVCGGRDYADYERVAQALDAIHQRDGIARLIHGACRGADLLGEQWAKTRGVPYVGVPYKKGLGARGGPIRNQQMIDEEKPDLVVAFPGGTGTADMVR